MNLETVVDGLHSVGPSWEKKSALAKFVNYHSKLEKVVEPRESSWGLKGRNKEQTFAMCLLNDPEIPIVTLITRFFNLIVNLIVEP